MPHEWTDVANALIRQNFAVGEPNRRYAGDITYIPTGEGWLYLASALDLGSRRLAGWAMADHMRSELVEKALIEAAALRGSVAGAIFHADRESPPNRSNLGSMRRNLPPRRVSGDRRAPHLTSLLPHAASFA